MEWSEHQTMRLRELWLVEPKLSAAAIGREIGMSKNAVVGKAHRLDLPARESPIRTGKHTGPRPPPKPYKPPREPKQTLPPLNSVVGSPSNSFDGSPATPCPDAPVQPVPTPPVRAPRPDAPVQLVPTKPCTWPFGDPGSKAFRYCGAPSVLGKPYCPEHCQHAYRKFDPIPRREAA